MQTTMFIYNLKSNTMQTIIILVVMAVIFAVVLAVIFAVVLAYLIIKNKSVSNVVQQPVPPIKNSGLIKLSGYEDPSLFDSGVAITGFWEGEFAQGTKLYKDFDMTSLVLGQTFVAYGNNIYKLSVGVIGSIYYTKF